MNELALKIEFFSEWHCGSGLASGSDLDLLVIKDRKGFPYVPGRTLKGLLRDAAVEMSSLRSTEPAWQRFVEKCFGRKSDSEAGEQASSPGCLHFSNAELSESIRKAIEEIEKARPSARLYRKRAGTAIDENGQAKEHTLRRMETTVPMTLHGRISGCPVVYAPCLRDCLCWVKRLGVLRHRGLGRCRISEVES
jgi:CRISPR/Cas system CSM-associated protein Csm3 (group 7 of RAMP superfamily)